MVDVLKVLAYFFLGFFKSRSRLEAENSVLRHQLAIALRRAPGQLLLRPTDRLIFMWLYRICPRALDALVVVKPATVMRWHRAGFGAYWRGKSRNPGGRPKVEDSIRELIRVMSRDNPLWVAPRIHGELLRLGIEVSQTTVAKDMIRRTGPPSQGWRAFLRNHRPEIAALDLFVVPTLGFRLLYGLVILRHDRRHLIATGVTANSTAEWTARQLTEVFPWETAPQFLIRDNDGAYGKAFTERLGAMGIRDRPVEPRSPWQNAYVERLIGSIRRECLDHVLILGENHLYRVLKAYADYYNSDRPHLALAKDAPNYRPIQRLGPIAARPILGGLHHCYGRM
jgi:transposase InsO family protein